MLIRLSKYIADAGVCSRRKAEEEILLGKVTVNGLIVAQLGTKVDTENDRVCFDRVEISYSCEMVYIMLHKPVRVVTTVNDELGRTTVMSFVKDIDARLVPIGRLDYNTSGQLFMTNDGDLTYKLTHPKHNIEKIYLATIMGVPTEIELNRFRDGLEIEHYKTAPAKIYLLNVNGKGNKKTSNVKIKISEGKNRQIRKMCAAIGHEVITLKRIATGKLPLGNLEKGKYRHLTASEVMYLKRLSSE